MDCLLHLLLLLQTPCCAFTGIFLGSFVEGLHILDVYLKQRHLYLYPEVKMSHNDACCCLDLQKNLVHPQSESPCSIRRAGSFAAIDRQFRVGVGVDQNNG